MTIFVITYKPLFCRQVPPILNQGWHIILPFRPVQFFHESLNTSKNIVIFSVQSSSDRHLHKNQIRPFVGTKLKNYKHGNRVFSLPWGLPELRAPVCGTTRVGPPPLQSTASVNSVSAELKFKAAFGFYLQHPGQWHQFAGFPAQNSQKKKLTVT